MVFLNLRLCCMTSVQLTQTNTQLTCNRIDVIVIGNGESISSPEFKVEPFKMRVLNPRFTACLHVAVSP